MFTEYNSNAEGTLKNFAAGEGEGKWGKEERGGEKKGRESDPLVLLY